MDSEFFQFSDFVEFLLVRVVDERVIGRFSDVREVEGDYLNDIRIEDPADSQYHQR